MFKIQFSTENAAFEGGDLMSECARILREIADNLERGRESGGVHDVNGNRVGNWEITAR